MRNTSFILHCSYLLQRSRHHRDSATSDSPKTTHITLLETSKCALESTFGAVFVELIRITVIEDQLVLIGLLYRDR